MSKRLFDEMQSRYGQDSQNIFSFWRHLVDVKPEKASVIEDPLGQPIDVVPYVPQTLPHKVYDTVNQAASAFYDHKQEENRIRQLRNRLAQSLRAQIKSLNRKIDKQKEELHEINDYENWRIMGELLLSQPHSLSKNSGLTAIELVNYYDSNQNLITIPVDGQLSTADNARRYFHKYQKAKRRLDALLPTYEQNQWALLALQETFSLVETATSLEELELLADDVLENNKKRAQEQKAPKNKKETVEARPLKFILKDGSPFWVGRNRRQNDELTMRFAKPDDIWFHAKDMPGSHGLLRPNT